MELSLFARFLYLRAERFPEFNGIFSADRNVDKSAYEHGNGADIGIGPLTLR